MRAARPCPVVVGCHGAAAENAALILLQLTIAIM
jgi:hypothetical protein